MKIFNKKKDGDITDKTTIKVSQNEIQEKIQGSYITFCGISDVGRQRKHNEDSYLMFNLNRNLVMDSEKLIIAPCSGQGVLLVVTDGMGGAAAGDIASRMVRDTLEEWFKENWYKKDLPSDEFPTILQGGIKEANRRIIRQSEKHAKYKGMGATLTAAGIIDDQCYIAQVGDSRGYLVRQNSIRQVTKDQSLVNKLIETGNITKEEARHHMAKNVILQAIGVNERLEIGSNSFRLNTGDHLLLCSDGLTDMLSDAEILEIVISENDVMAIVKKLINAANQAGGKDNITTILGRFASPGQQTENREAVQAKTRQVNLEDIKSAETKPDKTSKYIVPPDKEEF